MNDLVNQPASDQTAPATASRAGEEFYRLQFAENSSVMLLLDPEDGRIIDANAAASAFYGHDRARLLAMRIGQINTLPPGAVAGRLRDALSGNRSHFEFQHRLADGSIRDVEVFSSPVPIGGRLLLHAIIHDITPRKRAEQALQLMRFCVDRAGDCVFWTSLQGRILYVNDAACANRGYSREELLGMTVFDLDPDYHPGNWGPHVEELRRRGSLTFETRHRRKDGSVFPIEVTSNHIRSGEEEFIFAFVRNITARKHAEAERQKFVALADSSREFIGMCDREFHPIYLNDAGLKMTGLESREAAFRVRVQDFFFPEDQRFITEEFFPRVLREGHGDVEIRFRHFQTGEAIWMLYNVFNIRDADGAVVGWATVSRNIHDRKLAEAALAQRERRYRTLFDHSPAGIVLEDTSGRIVEVNQAYCALTGFTREELLGRDVRMFVPPAEQRIVDRNLARILAGETLDHEVENVDRAGLPRHVQLRETAIPLPDGGQGVMVLVQDVTERRRAVEELRQRDAIMEAVSGAATALLGRADWKATMQSTLDALGRASDVSRAYVFEFRPGAGGEVLASQTFEWVAEGVEPQIDNPDMLNFPMFAHGFGHWLGIFEKGGIISGHVRDLSAAEQAVLASQDIRSILVVPIMAGGQIWGMLGFDECRAERDWAGPKIRAIETAARTLGAAIERHRVEDSLRASETRFREVAESISEVFWITSVDKTRVLYISPAYERIWGRTCQSLQQRPEAWIESVVPEDRERVLRAALERQASGEYDLEYRIARPDGQVRWIHDRAFPVRDGGGKVIRIAGVAEDITKARQLEEQLRHSQKMDAIGQLAGGVAHDFNNILAALILQAELTAMDETLPASAVEGLNEIRAAGQRAAALTRQLLLFSRRQVLQPRDLDLNELVTNLVKMLQRIIGEDIRLQLRLHPAPLLTRADAGMLDQVLMNLSVNARDAMPEGGCLLIETSELTADTEFARLHPDAAPGRYVCLAVADTGRGIPPELLPRIFEPFFTTKDVGKGTGLGLATVFGIVKQHGGWIQVQSESGRGARFEVFLPARDPASAAERHVETRIERRGGTETILLVEDEPAVRSVTRVMLERHGYRVLEAADGLAALGLWQESRTGVALLLTDLVMPGGLSGQQLARHLQEDQPRLKVIFLSGYSADIAGKELMLRPGENFLSKPYSPGQLLEAVRHALDG
jgi:PAS domain S-box-containing protein